MSSVGGRFVRGAALFAGLLLAVGVLVAGCAGSEQNRELTVGNINWGESIAVPSYVNIQTVPQLNQTNIREILGIEPGTVISRRIPESVIPTYDLEQDYVESSSTAGKLGGGGKT